VSKYKSGYEGAPVGSIWRCHHDPKHPDFIVTAVVLEEPATKRMSAPPVYQTALYTYISAFNGEPVTELHEFFRIDLQHMEKPNKWYRVA